MRVELIVNGEPADTTTIAADGNWNDISFNYPVKRSCWIALRIYTSSHTNPVFVHVDGKPIRELKSAEWCRQVVDQCWKTKHPNIRESDRKAAGEAYEKARQIYDRIITESK